MTASQPWCIYLGGTINSVARHLALPKVDQLVDVIWRSYLVFLQVLHAEPSAPLDYVAASSMAAFKSDLTILIGLGQSEIICSEYTAV